MSFQRTVRSKRTVRCFFTLRALRALRGELMFSCYNHRRNDFFIRCGGGEINGGTFQKQSGERGKTKGGNAGGTEEHFDFFPTEIPCIAGGKRLAQCFLRGESHGVLTDRILSRCAVPNFLIREQFGQYAVAESVDGVPDPFYFYSINADADDHG